MSDKPYVLSLDVGTSSLRVALYDAQGRPVPGAHVATPHSPRTTPDGGVEMDADDLLERLISGIEQLIDKTRPAPGEIAAVGMCTYWHSILGVDAHGSPTTPIILWADTRSGEQVDWLKRRLVEREVHARTGCVQHVSYVPSKLLWLAQNRTEQFSRSAHWMSPGEYIYSRLFGERACSYGMASGTGLLNHDRLAWDEGVLAALPVEAEQLSPLVDFNHACRGLRPEFARRLPLLAETLWYPPAGDGACNNLGSGCVGPDRVALMIGTSGATRVMSDRGEPRAPFGLWCYRLDARRFLVGGAVSNGGNLFAWLRDSLRVPEGEELEAALAAVEPDGHGLTMLPFLAGERCPGWRGDARAAIVGLSWSTRPEEIVRAGLESVAYRFALIHQLLRPTAAPVHEVIATGGGLLSSPTWTQIMADTLGVPVIPSEEEEASGRGAALLALEAAGILDSAGDAPFDFGEAFQPDPQRHARYMEGLERHRRLYELLVAAT